MRVRDLEGAEGGTSWNERRDGCSEIGFFLLSEVQRSTGAIADPGKSPTPSVSEGERPKNQKKTRSGRLVKGDCWQGFIVREKICIFASLKHCVMIEFVKGRIIERNPAYVIVETAGGVGYMIHISLATFSNLKEDEEARILTHYVIREDAQLLYGFYDEEERTLFRLLISVNGIGVNTARLMLSSLSVQELINGIATENVKLIQSIKGIGAKTAQRVIIELKDKIGKRNPQNMENFSFSYNNNKSEALSALVSLGFVKNSADTVLDKIIQSEGVHLSVEDLIKKALKLL